MRKTKRQNLKDRKCISQGSYNSRKNLSVCIENSIIKKSTAGITLLALVVTIIILLILSGITISSLTRRQWLNK